MSGPSLGELIAAAKRELILRQHTYPRLINIGRMKQPKADHELACAREWLRLLEELHKNAVPLEAVDINVAQLIAWRRGLIE